MSGPLGDAPLKIRHSAASNCLNILRELDKKKVTNLLQRAIKIHVIEIRKNMQTLRIVCTFNKDNIYTFPIQTCIASTKTRSVLSDIRFNWSWSEGNYRNIENIRRHTLWRRSIDSCRDIPKCMRHARRIVGIPRCPRVREYAHTHTDIHTHVHPPLMDAGIYGRSMFSQGWSLRGRRIWSTKMMAA